MVNAYLPRTLAILDFVHLMNGRHSRKKRDFQCHGKSQSASHADILEN